MHIFPQFFRRSLCDHKLAKELAKGKNTKNVLYILDEPTTGLSFFDCERLIQQDIAAFFGKAIVIIFGNHLPVLPYEHAVDLSVAVLGDVVIDFFGKRLMSRPQDYPFSTVSA